MDDLETIVAPADEKLEIRAARQPAAKGKPRAPATDSLASQTAYGAEPGNTDLAAAAASADAAAALEISAEEAFAAGRVSTEFSAMDAGATDAGATDLGETDLGALDLGATDLGPKGPRPNSRGENSRGAKNPGATAPGALAAKATRKPAVDPAEFKGYVDGLNHQWRIVGWARPLAPDTQRLQVQLTENDTVLDTTLADMFRGDLLGAMIGDGKYGFSLKIPQSLFDGFRHTLFVRAMGVTGENQLGKLEVALPNRTPKKAGGAPRTAAELLAGILPNLESREQLDLESHAPELTRVLESIARIYDHATALGLLYIHVLCRRIDNEGLQTRLTRLSNIPGEMGTIVSEVLASDEARNLYITGAANRFPDISALEAWTRLRRLT